MHPREVFSHAIRYLAHSLIVAHNHPSGDCAPSDRDREVTHHLLAAGKVVGIPLVDHLIIGRSSYFSFSGQRLIESSY
jgi:DNA repair protein RadC